MNNIQRPLEPTNGYVLLRSVSVFLPITCAAFLFAIFQPVFALKRIWRRLPVNLGRIVVHSPARKETSRPWIIRKGFSRANMRAISSSEASFSVIQDFPQKVFSLHHIQHNRTVFYAKLGKITKELRKQSAVSVKVPPFGGGTRRRGSSS